MALSRGGSMMLILSYVFDWIVIIIAAAVSYVFGNQTPNMRPFSLASPEISYPYVAKEKISTGLLFVIALVIPAVVILFVALIFIPGPTVSKSVPKALIWRRKAWEWYTGWTGLALSCVTAWLITNGMKNLIGHPRPDLLARCLPSSIPIPSSLVSTYPTLAIASGLYSPTLCTQTDSDTLNDGFRSFPSGHSSFSAAGLVYLSLFLAAKFAVTIPFLPYTAPAKDHVRRIAAFPSRMEREHGSSSNATSSAIVADTEPLTPARNLAAAPPLYLLVSVLAPLCAAIYVASTRYSDFRHRGFDILFGFLLGTITAVGSFRWYHLPIGRGAGWAWGPRKAGMGGWWVGVGVGSYAAVREQSQEIGSGVNGVHGNGINGDDSMMTGEPSIPKQRSADAGQIV